MATTVMDMQPATVPGQQVVYGDPFPLVYACNAPNVDAASVKHWLDARGTDLIAQADLHGAILFRGLPLSTAHDFDAFVAASRLPNFAYRDSLSNAVRVNLTERVFTANEAPPDFEIYMHHEMAQTPIYPSRLFFFCEKPAEQGGATPICRSDLLYDKLCGTVPNLAHTCEAKGLKYTNVMPAEADLGSGMGRSWQSTFRAQIRRDAEQRMGELGYSWEWLADGSLRATTPTLPATRRLPTGRTSFFNQLIAASKGWKDARNDPARSITYGDGSPLDAAEVLAAAELAEQLTFDVPWQAGNVALVANYVVMHGRRPFTGTRKVLASLIGA